MKYKGFTLAEILITLAIIGVVSALTIPTLSTTYKKKVFATSLQVAKADFEGAMHRMLEREGVDNLFDTNAWRASINGNNYVLNANSADTVKEAFRDNLTINLPIQSFSNMENIKLIDGTDFAIEDPIPVTFTTEKGVRYSIQMNETRISLAETTAYERGTGYLSQAATEVYIDVNGEAGPNRLGRDIFYYELSADGRLYPMGGRDELAQRDVGYSDPSNNCFTVGDTCAAYLAENNYNMDY